MVRYVQTSHGYSERRACSADRPASLHPAQALIRNPRLALRQRMHEIVRTRVRYGYRRVHILLKREGWSVGRNRRLPALPRRRASPAQQTAAAAQDGDAPGGAVPTRAPDEAWTLDFVHDALDNGQKFRALTVMDVFTREGLAIEVGHRLRGEHVVEVLNRLVRQRGAPQYLFADNGAEFTGHLVDLWAYHHGTRIDFSRPGKPTDNAYIETFNGSLRDECLNLHWFETIVPRPSGSSKLGGATTTLHHNTHLSMSLMEEILLIGMRSRGVFCRALWRVQQCLSPLIHQGQLG